MRKTLTVLVALAALALAAPAQAADVPDAISDIFSGVAEQIGDSEAIGAARVIGFGDGDNKTIVLAATPVKLNGEPLRSEMGRLTLTLDYVYDPMFVVDVLYDEAELDFYGGIGGRADYQIGSEHVFIAAGIAYVSDEISDTNVAGYLAGGWTYALRE